MQLLRVGRLGAFDSNSRSYAVDDLMVGASDPFQLSMMMYESELADALRPDSVVSFTLDPCHKLEPKIPGQIRSIMNVQEAMAKALLLDHEVFAAAQQADSVPGPNGILRDAYNTDGRRILDDLREEQDQDRAPWTPSPAAVTLSRSRPSGWVATKAGWGA